MTSREAFETFHKKRMCLQVAMPGSHGFHKDYAYSDAQVAWNAWDAACDWQKKQIDLYLDEVRFELPEDIRRKLFYND